MKTKIVYILEYDMYYLKNGISTRYTDGKPDSHRMFYDRSERQNFLDNWERLVNDTNDVYDNIKGYAVSYADCELNLDNLLKSF